MSAAQYQTQLNWISDQQDTMLKETLRWASINSGSLHLEGLERMAVALRETFVQHLAPSEVELIDLMPMESVDAAGNLIKQNLGKMLRMSKHPDAPIQVLLTGHMDTVYGKDHAFQKSQHIDDNIVNGPGVADMKGGLSILMTALEALEKSPWAGKVGWEVMMNPDEEIGSIGSVPFLLEAAKRNHFGLTFEPCLADGALASSRKGSGNFVAVVRGKAAHAGRNPEDGRNAIAALARFITSIFALNGGMAGVTVNPGKLEGGGPVNVVPDLAICRFNVRVKTPEEQAWIVSEIQRITSEIAEMDGILISLHGGFTRPPKVLSTANLHLFDLIRDCGKALGLTIIEKPSGGCCDGNNLAAAGLPNVDSLGVRGGNIHSSGEFMLADSLSERAQLAGLLLMRLASGEIDWPYPKKEPI